MLGSVVTGVRVGCMSVWAHVSACIQDVWDCVRGVCMGVHTYVCICAVVVCVSIGEQVWGVSGVRAVCLHNGVCLCGGLVWTSVDVGLCVCVRVCTRVCRCVLRLVSWCTPCCCHLGSCRHLCRAEHRCVVVKQHLARLVLVTALHTAALLLVSVHEHTVCTCRRGELPPIRTPCVNIVVQHCRTMSEWCPCVETPSDGTGRPSPAAGAWDESHAAPFKFISEVWGVVTGVVLLPEPP